ncbi:EAL domain-containing protein [Syntrophotalea acetylenica]|uniref:putative bifunctional diguanylate cyclase/phosphodiesterase n=1 Tax=Syntrophotalea acetylenica TaxID=29542 RepID=UPI002A3719C0|nr:EAL domain-containing protein [Syntrophotalea acetylenica]MDY0261072.1 EAL domain-containing protein [Syntrophotalea acetylenica]
MLGILFLLVLLCNSLPLTCGVPERLLLAGIPVLVIVRLYGGGWGTCAALMAPLFALASGRAAIPEFVWVAEAAAVGFILKRGINSLTAAAILFWGLLAWPVLYLVYGVLMQYPSGDLVQIIGWTTINGLGNAILAAALLHLLQHRGLRCPVALSFLETEINAIAAAFMLPALVILVLNVQGPSDCWHPGTENQLANHCRTIQHRLDVLHADLSGKLSALMQPESVQNNLEMKIALLLKQEKRLLQISVWDDRGRMLVRHSAPGDTPIPAAFRPAFSPREVRQIVQREKPTLVTLPANGPRAALPGIVCPVERKNGMPGFILGIIDASSYTGILEATKKRGVEALILDGADRVLVGGGETWKSAETVGAALFDRSSPPGKLLLWDPAADNLSRLSLQPARPASISEDRRPPRLLLSVSVGRLHAHNQKRLLTSMGLLLLPGLVALGVAFRVQSRILHPLKKLASATSDLPEKIRDHIMPQWPAASISEILELTRHCQNTAQAFAECHTELEKQRRRNSETMDKLLAQHRWESFTSSRQLEKTTQQLAREKHQRHRIQELIDSIDMAESRYQLLIENSLVGIFVFQNHRYTYVNPRFAEIFGYDPEEITEPKQQPQFVHPDDQLLVTANYLKILGGSQAAHMRYEFVGLRKTGETLHVEVLIGRGTSDGKPALIGSLLDITERKEAEKTIEHLAFHDPLTGLPNRLLFMDRVNQAIARAHRHHESFALMFLDLDRFKTLNDSLGHTAGDEALREVAKRLDGCLRETDTVSRFGGDEFNILLSQSCHDEEIELVAHKILKALAWPYDINGHEVFMTCSIGIAIYPKDGHEANNLIKNADTALYRAKDLGRNNFQFYSSSMNARALERIAMESSLRRMFERQELRVHYQPQVDLKDGHITGLEGLIRWEHPVGNMIAPSVFVPLAEETGLIVPMGEWILQAGCYQLRTWLDAGYPPMRLGINVSAHQLQKSDFAQLVIQILKECNLPPEYLNLEITETVIMHNMSRAFDTLRELRSVGITISIDDFGTGFSSLSYLKDLPADHLKIDRAFVQNLPFSSDESNIARHIIQMAHGLNLKVIAEGVENYDQLNFLREAGCDEIQGFLVSRPLPAENITEILSGCQPLTINNQQPGPNEI